jgi:hypothetical protein
MNRGKQTCKILKEIRQQIAEKNDIEFITSECHFQGECQGTCPKCESELTYLENQLQKRRQLGKAATIAGISLGIAGTFATLPALHSCDWIRPLEGDPITPEIHDTITPEKVNNEWLLGDIALVEYEILRSQDKQEK